MSKLLELITREFPYANIFVREVSVEVQDCVARFIATGEEIPIEHLSRQTLVPDGLYTASEATCSGSCSIGKPSPKCVAEGAYSKQKCSVIYLEKPNEISMEVYRLSKEYADELSATKEKLELSEQENAELRKQLEEREGWQLVPIEPTEHMLQSALDCQDFDPADNDECEVYAKYKAILNAAPKP